MGTIVVALIILVILVDHQLTKADNSASASVSVSSTECSRSCGEGKSTIQVNYPFGFSEGCQIRLNCNNSRIAIGEFEIQNVTTTSIFLHIPAKCNRSIEALKPLFDHNYALTWQNSLLLQNCTPRAQQLLNGCMIETRMIESRFDLLGCDAKSDNISCYSKERGESEFLSYVNVSNTQCRFLFSSMAVSSTRMLFELNLVELGWWLNGKCNCSEHAYCTKVKLVSGGAGFRCHCNDGFHGDGYAKGYGCLKISACDNSRYVSGHCQGVPWVGVLIGGILFGAALAGLALFCFFCRRRRSNSLRSRTSAKRLLCEAAGGSTIPFYPYKEIERATSGFSEKQMLGTGAYGTVYAGNLYDAQWVAIKKIKNRDMDSVEQVMNEIKLLSSVSHPNLVRLLGCCIEKGEQILVYEYMANGTLSQHLQKERGRGLPWTIRLNIASECAQAIAHLHSAINPPIYHRDIKSSNILLDRNYRSKVADFGLSRLGMTESSLSHISTAPQGTPGYLDPQYHQNFHLSDKSDVYSFGVVLIEIITALKVVDFSRPHSEVNLAALAVDRISRGCTDDIIDPFLDPSRDAWTLTSIHKVAELAFRCLAFDQDMRPSMTEVADELEQIRLSGWAPMEENMCMGASSVSSSCSYGSETSVNNKKMAVLSTSRRLILSHHKLNESALTLEVEDNSPILMDDPWFSGQSSPSETSLLGNVTH